jgi:hypothetical protein
MTPGEQRECARELGGAIGPELAELNRSRRERQLRAGQVRPRDRAELEIFAADSLKGKREDQQPPVSASARPGCP